jgi:hypothetical protein
VVLPSRSDDVELLRRIAGGDDDAFSTFYREHLDAVVAFFRRRSGWRWEEGRLLAPQSLEVSSRRKPGKRPAPKSK